MHVFFNKALFLIFFLFIVICKHFGQFYQLLWSVIRYFRHVLCLFLQKNSTVSTILYWPILCTFNHVFLFSLNIEAFYTLFHVFLMTKKKVLIDCYFFSFRKKISKPLLFLRNCTFFQQNIISLIFTFNRNM